MKEQSAPGDHPRIAIEMWSDLGCPWCYVGRHRLRTAIAQRPDADRFEIVMRSFPLDPEASTEPERNETSFLRTHPGATASDVQRAEAQMTQFAHTEGLDYVADRMNANTFGLHRVIQYATDQGSGSVFASAVQDGFFAGTLNPHDTQALMGVAESVGLDGARIREILASDEYADRVHSDQDEALELGATGVPFVVIDRRVAAAGAQKVSVYARMLEQVAGPADIERAS